MLDAIQQRFTYARQPMCRVGHSLAGPGMLTPAGSEGQLIEEMSIAVQPQAARVTLPEEDR